jgi:uncharacterized membrane protein
MKSSRSKKIVDFVIGLLGILKWLPLGKYKEIVVVLSAVLATVSGLLAKCDVRDDPLPTPTVTTTPVPTESPTPVRTPTPLPTPEIVVDRQVRAGEPFTVRYTAPFKFNTHLWSDKWRLQIMGHDSRDGYMIAPAVVLNTAGKRRLTVRDLQGNVLAEKWITVEP